MMLTTRFQPRPQAASRCRTRAAGRSAVLRVVAFKDGDEEQAIQQQELARAKVTFQLPLHVEWGQEVALVGAADSLGNWDVERCIPMSWNDGDMWTAQAELPTNTSIEYKYIIRAGEGEVKAVVEWQPCNNMELQAEQPELTIRDAWEGQQHEVLPGTLPVPQPPVPEPLPADTPEAPVPVEAQAEAVVAPVVVEAPAAAVPEVTAQAEPVVPLAAAEAEELPQPPPAAAPATAEKPESPAAAVAAATPVVRSTAGRRSTSSRTANGSKPAGGNSSRSKIVAAAATEAPVKQAAPAPEASAVKYGSLSTSELREVCQERGVSPKGQRRDLLARLQQLLQHGRKA